MKRTIPELFIIESLTLKDEESNRQEGDIIKKMLHLAGKTRTKYFYIRTEKELDEIIDIFNKSNYRYLHISCHANSSEMSTTFDEISFHKLGEMLSPCLENRRVFVSACEMANYKLAKELIPNTGCNSLIGPQNAIRFDDAAAFWVSFYHLMFKANDKAMKVEALQKYISKLSALFEEPINYYSASKISKQGFKKIKNIKI